jgi:hypothetical protein
MTYNHKEYLEWVKGLKSDRVMLPIYRAKRSEAVEILRQNKIECDRVHREWIDKKDVDGMVSWMLDRWVRHVEEKEKEVRKWEYHIRLASGKVSEKEKIDIEIVKQGVRIEDLLDIPIKTFGKTMVLCPVHNERSPSCAVYHSTNSFYCFGCNKGGSVIDLLIERDGLPIKEAVTMLNSMC